MPEIDQERIREIVTQVVRNLTERQIAPTTTITAPRAANNIGTFSSPEAAIKAAKEAQAKLVQMGMNTRKNIIDAIRRAGLEQAEMLAQMAFEETKIGVVKDKVAKNEAAANLTPGLEDLCSEATTGDNGLLLVERAPYGVINAITPVTNPTSTIINNGIIMVAGGNSIVFSPHPDAKKCTLKTMTLINEAIVKANGPENLMTAVAEPSLRTAKIIMEHPDIDMVVATGGGSVVRAALSTGKKAIAAGPGNPVVVVDETADIPHAAQCIIEGARFDNNLLCIGEKSVFVLAPVADELIQNMCQCGAQLVSSSEFQEITKLVVKNGGQNREFVGKYASEILQSAGIDALPDTKIIIAETNAEHVIVTEEFLMPIIPIIRTNDFDEAVKLAVATEGGNYHTAIIHSRCTDRITQFAKAINTSVFVVNASSLASAGVGGEGFLAMTIAGSTGEGFTRPIHFTRERRLTFASGISIHSL